MRRGTREKGGGGGERKETFLHIQHSEHASSKQLEVRVHIERERERETRGTEEGRRKRVLNPKLCGPARKFGTLLGIAKSRY